MTLLIGLAVYFIFFSNSKKKQIQGQQDEIDHITEAYKEEKTRAQVLQDYIDEYIRHEPERNRFYRYSEDRLRRIAAVERKPPPKYSSKFTTIRRRLELVMEDLQAKLPYPTRVEINDRLQLTIQVESVTFFTSGSSDLTAAGRAAVLDLVPYFKSLAPYIILVEGHARDAEIVRPDSLDSQADSIMLDHWDLSTQRAVKVVKSLRTAKIPPYRLIAAGRSKYDFPYHIDTGYFNDIQFVITPWIVELPDL